MQSQNEAVLEMLKQNVLKWQEAASAIHAWMPKVHESDRMALAQRGKQYERNARETRELIETLTKSSTTEHLT